VSSVLKRRQERQGNQRSENDGKIAESEAKELSPDPSWHDLSP
jgi:hypothetical protein